MSQSFCSPRGIVASHTYTVYRYAALLAVLVLGACNSTPKTTEIIPGTSSVRIQMLAPVPLNAATTEHYRAVCQHWYDSVLKNHGFNGGMVVAKNGNIVFEAYNGTGRPGSTDTITDSTSFHIASVSKTFTAMAILKLWQDGKLNIDDEYSKYFPAFDYPGVTIRTMLNHRSGLPNYVHFMENMGWDKKVNITNETVLDFMINRKAEIPNTGSPNRGFAYCNTNYALLALLLEKISGKKYGDYLQETFFSPLQMHHTFVYDHTRDSGKVTMSYDWKGGLIPFNFLDQVYGDKNIYSTPRDLLTWDRALSSGILFNQKTLDEAYTPYSNEKPGVRNYGLGWRMNNYPTGKKMIYHNGWWHGNNAAFIRLTQDSATIIVLGNKYNRGIYHARDLANLFGSYTSADEEEESEASKPAEPVIRKKISKKVNKVQSKTKNTQKTRTAPVKKTAAGKKTVAPKKRHR